MEDHQSLHFPATLLLDLCRAILKCMEFRACMVDEEVPQQVAPRHALTADEKFTRAPKKKQAYLKFKGSNRHVCNLVSSSGKLLPRSDLQLHRHQKALIL